MAFVTRKTLPSPVHSAAVSNLLDEASRKPNNAAALSELRSISRERNPDIFYSSLLNFGFRQEDAGNEALAVQAYRAIQEGTREGGRAPSEVVKRASSRLSALMGQGGSVGDQVEVSFHHFQKELPTMLLTMTPGWLGFKAMRLIAGNGFMRWPVANALTRGFVPWLASTLAGIGVEGPILTAIQHGLGQGTSSWGKDLLTNYKVMLGMRGVGEAATMFSRVLGIPQGIWQAFIHQASTLGGMSLTQDLSPTQMLMNLGYFHFSGALTYGILGKHVARWEQALEPSAFRPAASGPAAWRGDMGTALPRFAYATASAKEPMMKSLRPESRRVVLDLDRVYAKGPKGSSDPGKVGVSPPKMIRIPGGKFRMGSKDFKDSRPVRGVELDPFLLGETPVTNAQYLEHVKARKNEPFVRMETAPDTGLTRVVAVGANPEIVLPRHLHRIIAGWDPSSPLIQGGLTLLKVAKPDLFSAGFDEPNQPVVMVNWHEALAYAALTVKGGRLPTEAEWEYAARGPQGFEYGTRSGQLTKAEAHYDAPSKADVGSYPPNDFGLRDMTGNVWEWTGDWYQDSYQDLPNKNPIGPAHGIHKALRGGAWDYSLPDSLRAAHRHHYRPVSRFNDIGFRVAASVSQDSK